jgi:hypothetical protein
LGRQEREATISAGVVKGLAMLAGTVLLAACSRQEPLPQVQASEPQEVSVIDLIANAPAWHGKLVRVIGFCRLEFEGNALYLHKEDFDRSISKNGIWLELGWPVPDKYRALTDQYVLVEAVFDAEEQGHMGMFSGMLRDIRRLERWPSQKEFGAKPPPRPGRQERSQ